MNTPAPECEYTDPSFHLLLRLICWSYLIFWRHLLNVTDGVFRGFLLDVAYVNHFHIHFTCMYKIKCINWNEHWHSLFQSSLLNISRVININMKIIMKSIILLCSKFSFFFYWISSSSWSLCLCVCVCELCICLHTCECLFCCGYMFSSCVFVRFFPGGQPVLNSCTWSHRVRPQVLCAAAERALQRSEVLTWQKHWLGQQHLQKHALRSFIAAHS